MPQFDIRTPDDLAPVYDAKGKLLGVAPYQHLASWNFHLGVELGLWDAPLKSDRASVDAVRPIVQDRPLKRLLATLEALPDSRRISLMQDAAEMIRASSGHELNFDPLQISSPWLFWFSDRLFGISSDHKVIFGLRANHSNMGTACLQPTGNGYRNTDSAGAPLTPETNSLLEMKQEFGLDSASATSYGLDRTMTILQFYNMAGKGGETRHPGVVITYATTSVTQLKGTADTLLRKATLNHENLGAVALGLEDLEKLVSGERVSAPIFWSHAPQAMQLLSAAKDVETGRKPFLSFLRDIASQPGAVQIPKDTTHKLNVRDPHTIGIHASDLQILDANYLGNALGAFRALGYRLSERAQAYISEEGHLEPMSGEKLNTLLPLVAPASQRQHVCRN